MARYKRRQLVIDMDSAVYACCFIAEKKMHYAIVERKIIYQTDNKNKYNKWFKELQETDPELAEKVEYDLTEELLPFKECMIAVDGFVRDMKKATGIGTRPLVLLTKGGDCYRTHLATLKKYKGNRDNMTKPVYYDRMRKYIAKKYGAKMYRTYEADDAASMALAGAEGKRDELVILGHIDKDLEQCLGKHYNPNKKNEGVYYTDLKEAAYHLYKQALTGDTTDNIPGLFRVGAKHKWVKALDGMDTIEDMERHVYQCYLDKYGEEHTYTPWWWDVDKYNDEMLEDYKDRDLVLAKREQFPDKEITVPTWKIMRENLDLLYMLRSPRDQYLPTCPELKALWEPYKNGVVKEFCK